ncbi:PIN domain-containing protein [Pararhizobium sp. IMCC21322]|uniref:PIN domain-containing protein n=1 Tax=Pararhizobium sp. IMCC21322 TaxID=3067903 RepID=UPI00274298E3|nr:PIN domain-containing protein [Pararhizobium sp. IMCC21322]
MPIVNDEELKALLARDQISAISIDTSIFHQKRLQLNSATLQSFAGLTGRPFDFLLSETVAKEVLAHLEKSTSDSLRSTKIAIGKALFSFETVAPTREELLTQISGGRTAEQAASARWDKYIADTNCEVLDDANLVDTATIYDDYFAGEPPFGSGRKKDEFPDALALNALEQIATDRDIGILVISKDGDWKAFCNNSPRLFLGPEIERALSLITDAPLGLRTAVTLWLAEDGDGSDEFQDSVSDNIERLDFTANASPNHGEVEIFTWAGELKSLGWPSPEEIDIIELVGRDDDGVMRVVVSLPVSLVVKVQVELNFSFWDSVDKESVEMGGRGIEVEEEIEARTTVTLDVHSLGTPNQQIEFIESKLDDLHHEIELGTVDVFESEDYEDEDEAEQP